jgi:exopolysaccharide biosynthesis WecB/TagA/CpsF family protein
MNEPFPALNSFSNSGAVSFSPAKTCQVFGISYARLDLQGAVEEIAARPQRAPFAYVATPNAVHVVGVDRGEPQFVASIEGAYMRTCDSQVVRLFAWLLFRVHLPRAAGSDITRLLFENKIAANDPLCVIGGTVEMAERLRTKYNLQRLVQHIPPHGFIFNPDAVAECAAFVRANPSRFVFLACGAPQSEALGLYIAEHGGASGLGLCIGASLLFLTGIIRRAPKAWRDCGLEWLYRLLQEPRRLVWRLLTGQLPFLWVAIRYRFEKALPATKQPSATGAASSLPQKSH